jgi:hypothetical protein
MTHSQILQITIDNQREIELFELVGSMSGINDQYHRFLRQSKREKVRSDSKLYVQKISDGSIIIDLCEKALPLLPGVPPLLVEYSNFLVKAFDYLTGRASELPALYRFQREDFQNIKKIVDPAAKYSGNNLRLCLIDNSTVVTNNIYNYVDANAAQNASQVLK